MVVFALFAAVLAATQVAPPAVAPDVAHGGTISGRLITPDRKPLLSAAVIINPQVGEGRLTPDGFFSFTNVPPGRYVIRARGEISGNPASLFATFSVTMQSRDVSGIELTLTPGATIDGRVAVAARRGSAPPALSALRVRAPLVDGAEFGDTTTGTVKPDGTFRLRGLMSGAHVLMIEGLAFPWRIAEARVRGLDAFEHAIDLERDEVIHHARIVVTDTAAGVSGTVPLPPGVASDVIVIAFPANPLRRSVPLRFVRVGRVSDAGTFRIVDLVPGDYLVAAAYALTDADAMRVAVLNRLAPDATVVRLSEGQVAETTLRPPISAAGTLP